jgi:type II secretory pathway component PulK
VKRDGYVIIAVLVVIVVLSLAAYQFADLMSAEHRSAARVQNSVQARQNAVSGIHFAAAMLADQQTFFGDLQGDPTAEGAFPDNGISQSSRNNRFALVSVVSTGNGSYEQRYGAVIDESSKLNINSIMQVDTAGETLAAALTALATATSNSALTPEVIDAIVDWLDADDDPRTNGAESSYYLSTPGQYRAKNGPLNSIDELLLVRGVTPQLLYGTDRNRNGVADDEGAGPLDRGLADYLTAYGRELNLDTTGLLRENINETEDLPALYSRLQTRIGNDMATFIMAYKTFQTVSTTASTSNTSGTMAAGTQMGGASDLQAALQASLDAGTAVSKRRLKSLLDLQTASITVPKPPDAAPDAPTIVVPSPFADPSKLSTLLGDLMDKATVTTLVEMPPRINVNTAPREVLMMLTGIAGGTSSTGSAAGLQESDIDAILNLRQNLNPADPATLTGAWMLQEGGISPAVFKKLEKYITGRSMVYRIHSIGYFGEGGPVARVEAVVDTNQGFPRILYFRDLTDLDNPRGFDPPR